MKRINVGKDGKIKFLWSFQLIMFSASRLFNYRIRWQECDHHACLILMTTNTPLQKFYPKTMIYLQINFKVDNIYTMLQHDIGQKGSIHCTPAHCVNGTCTSIEIKEGVDCSPKREVISVYANYRPLTFMVSSQFLEYALFGFKN